MNLLNEVIDAHGGRRRWKKVNGVKARVEGAGALLRLKGKTRQFRSYVGLVDTERQHVVLEPYPDEGQRGIFDEGDVRIESGEGEVLGERKDAREAFFGAAGLARNLRWGNRDALYFSAYALWNYLNMPFVLEWAGVRVVEGEPVEGEDGGELRCLDVEFPDGFHTHCRDQSFYFDGDGMLRRHDYHPDVLATFAYSCQLCSGHREFGGIVFPTSRRVVPRSPTGAPLAGPTMISLELTEIDLV